MNASRTVTSHSSAIMALLVCQDGSFVMEWLTASKFAAFIYSLVQIRSLRCNQHYKVLVPVKLLISTTFTLDIYFSEIRACFTACVFHTKQWFLYGFSSVGYGHLDKQGLYPIIRLS